MATIRIVFFIATSSVRPMFRRPACLFTLGSDVLRTGQRSDKTGIRFAVQSSSWSEPDPELSEPDPELSDPGPELSSDPPEPDPELSSEPESSPEPDPELSSSFPPWDGEGVALGCGVRDP
jgi:hypothetical protein